MTKKRERPRKIWTETKPRLKTPENEKGPINKMPTLKTICRECGKEGAAEVSDFAFAIFSQPGNVYPWRCPECERNDQARKRAKRERERQSYIEEELAEAGVPRRYRVRAPFVPFVAQWMERNAGINLLVTGETGCGKSTSAGYLARVLIGQEKRVKWLPLSRLLDQWRASRRGDWPESSAEFLARIENCDLLIIDEASGDKTTNTDSTRECMFGLLEDIYNGDCRAAVILLGNFYRGSIAEVFGNEEAARRRIDETFLAVRIDRRAETINQIML